MDQNLFERIARLNLAACQAVKELAEINAATVERLLGQQQAALSALLQAANAQAELLGQAGDYKELLAAEGHFASTQGRQVLDQVKQTAEILDEARERIAVWLEKGIAEASRPLAETLKNAA